MNYPPSSRILLILHRYGFSYTDPCFDEKEEPCPIAKDTRAYSPTRSLEGFESYRGLDERDERDLREYSPTRSLKRTYEDENIPVQLSRKNAFAGIEDFEKAVRNGDDYIPIQSTKKSKTVDNADTEN